MSAHIGLNDHIVWPNARIPTFTCDFCEKQKDPRTAVHIISPVRSRRFCWQCALSYQSQIMRETEEMLDDVWHHGNAMDRKEGDN